MNDHEHIWAKDGCYCGAKRCTFSKTKCPIDYKVEVDGFKMYEIIGNKKDFGGVSFCRLAAINDSSRCEHNYGVRDDY